MVDEIANIIEGRCLFCKPAARAKYDMQKAALRETG
jgi:hypothetical protein